HRTIETHDARFWACRATRNRPVFVQGSVAHPHGALTSYRSQTHRARASVGHATVRRAAGAVCSLFWLYRETNLQERRPGAADACAGSTGGDHQARRYGCAHDTRRSWRRRVMPWAICCVYIAGTGSITSGWSWTGGDVSP